MPPRRKQLLKPKRPPSEINAINRIGDRFEASFRRSFLLAVEELRESMAPVDLLEVIVQGRRQLSPILLAKIERIFKKHLQEIVIESFMQGGAMGKLNIIRLRNG
ncbi:hypothetical protein LCGC14_2126650 [marine sediment metagenome]|uniref:Uncharacterized protein n=1 Tax=marine sediment metagenome TaxID=412755 RepID=A0A0F9E2R0_9ZZZZ